MRDGKRTCQRSERKKHGAWNLTRTTGSFEGDELLTDRIPEHLTLDVGWPGGQTAGRNHLKHRDGMESAGAEA